MWEMIANANGIEKPVFQYFKNNRNEKKFKNNRNEKKFKNNRNEKKGVFIAGIIDNEICIGWSLCNKKDKFYVEDGVQIAIDRCYRNDRMEKYLSFEDYIPPVDIFEVIPFSMQSELYRFLNRITKYYAKFSNVKYSTVIEYLVDEMYI